MRRIQKVMIAIFCVGVILAGAGTGIALSEFSSLAYKGKIEVGPVDRKTTTLEYTFNPSEIGSLAIREFYGPEVSGGEIVSSPEVPENTVRFEITYNAETVKPRVHVSDERYLGLEYTYLADDFEIFMNCKDQILESLKRREIVSCDTVTIEKVRIMVNPATKDYVYME